MVETVTIKNVTIHCLNCNKKFQSVTKRAKFCSDACKMQYNRNIHKGATVTSPSDSVTIHTEKHNKDVTVTDQLFIEDAAKRDLVNWYRFDFNIHDRKCIWCKKLFKTRLQLNKYCSPDCRNNNFKPYIEKK